MAWNSSRQPTEPGAERPLLLAIMGPTASGKSELAEACADRLTGPIINADAFQVYRGFDVGTNKSQRKSSYELMDHCGPAESYGVGQWIKECSPILHRAWEGQSSAVIVGGTGFYIRALLEEYRELHSAPSQELRDALMRREADEGMSALVEELKDRYPLEAEKVDLRNPVRVRRALERLSSPKELIFFHLPNFRKVKVALRWPMEMLEARIMERTERLMEAWREEVQQILHRQVPLDAPAWRAIGYLSIAEWERGGITRNEAKETIIRQTRQYAKRQMTWLRAEPGLIWIEMNGTAPDWGALAESILAEYSAKKVVT